jgi:FkbH-like protein
MQRDEIDALITAGESAAAAAALKAMWRQSPQAATAAFVVSRFERIAARVHLAPMKVAWLRSFTIEPLLPLLRARAYVAGIDLQVTVAEYGVMAQALLAPGRLDEFAPDLVVLAALTKDFAPALWHAEGHLDSAADDTASQLHAWIAAFRARSAATILVHSFEQPAFATDGVLDDIAGAGQRRAIDRLNAALRATAAAHRGVYVLDYDALVARHGRLSWVDPGKDLALRVPLTPAAFAALADEYMRFLHALSGRVCKVLAVDLDNTLWGGVVGEDGASGITLGVEYPGSAYLALQRDLRALARRGVLLALCSKNNWRDAQEVLDEHPEMLLRSGAFNAIRVNWDDKAANLRAIAGELNVGLDAVALLDDNPVERDWVRAQAPDVYVIDLPDDPVGFVDALRRAPVFERLTLSAEDRARAGQYREQRERARAEAAAGSIEDFLRSLDMQAEIDDVTPLTLARVAQLTQKTNQFNVTTRRYTEEQIDRFAAAPGNFVRTVRVRDKYGDNGLVGVVMASAGNGRCEIDTLLLSCRVIGRQVETLLLADVAQLARRRGASLLLGRFIPTPKNAPAATLFADHGFTRRAGDETGSSWELDLTQASIAAPEFIQRT